jgi:ribosomal protein S18 acetylase RimI-like enzyme
MLQRDLSVGEMDPDRTCLVAIDDNDTVVGYVDFRHAANYSQIGALEVLKAVQRMGIGRQLVEEVINRCHGRTNSVSVAVDPLSPEAGFFARVGFRSGVHKSSDVAVNLWERII